MFSTTLNNIKQQKQQQLLIVTTIQWGIQDFSNADGSGPPTPEMGVKTNYLAIFFAENCMKMKEIGLGRADLQCSSLDPPMNITEEQRTITAISIPLLLENTFGEYSCVLHPRTGALPFTCFTTMPALVQTQYSTGLSAGVGHTYPLYCSASHYFKSTAGGAAA